MSIFNFYEHNMNDFIALREVFFEAIEKVSPDLMGGVAHIILWYLEPYAFRSMPLIDDHRMIESVGRQFLKVLPGTAVKSIIDFAYPNMIMSVPIPCTITTNGTIKNFNYDTKQLIDSVHVDRNSIESVGNIDGWVVAPGAPDPRNKKKPKKQKSANRLGKSKNGRGGTHLFGTAQTTFRVKTKHREPTKVFAVKVFQAMKIEFVKFSDGSVINSKQYPKFELELHKMVTENDIKLEKRWSEFNVILETLGGLHVDCLDTKDVNNIVAKEISRALGVPELTISNFHASMRNYSKFSIISGMNVDLKLAFIRLKEYGSGTFRKVRPIFNPNTSPALNVEIMPDRHTSKKKTITVKIFRSGKIEIDSVVFYEHIVNAFKFLNKFFLDNKSDVLYMPLTSHDYDSDYYYEKCGVSSAPLELRS